jgi:hypothetical protein
MAATPVVATDSYTLLPSAINPGNPGRPFSVPVPPNGKPGLGSLASSATCGSWPQHHLNRSAKIQPPREPGSVVRRPSRLQTSAVAAACGAFGLHLRPLLADRRSEPQAREHAGSASLPHQTRRGLRPTASTPMPSMFGSPTVHGRRDHHPLWCQARLDPSPQVPAAAGKRRGANRLREPAISAGKARSPRTTHPQRPPLGGVPPRQCAPSHPRPRIAALGPSHKAAAAAPIALLLGQERVLGALAVGKFWQRLPSD